MTLRRVRGRGARWKTLPWSILGARWYYRRVALIAAARGLAIRKSAKKQSALLANNAEATARRLRRVLEAVSLDRVDGETSVGLSRIEDARHRLLGSNAAVSWSGGHEAPAAWVCALASQPAPGARILYHCVSTWQPKTALELGTCVGVSAAYQAYGQKGVQGARLITVEAYAGLAAEARTLLADAGLCNVTCKVGKFEDALTEIVVDERLDYAYIDGHHSGEATLRYFETIRTHCNSEALLIFDDIDYSPSMAQAWARIVESEHVTVTATLGKLGLAVVR